MNNGKNDTSNGNKNDTCNNTNIIYINDSDNHGVYTYHIVATIDWILMLLQVSMSLLLMIIITHNNDSNNRRTPGFNSFQSSTRI